MRNFGYKVMLAVLICFVVLPDLSGQSYMRYKMSDNSFHGFYTSTIDSITHVTENNVAVSKVYRGETCIQTIPIDKIIDIAFESVSIDDEKNAGEYKIYELINEGEGFKKAYIDNRTMCLASKNGDFGANDTILAVSLYNQIKIIFYTDDQERITGYFDGVNYWLLDYAPDGTVNLFDYSKEKNTVNVTKLPGTSGSRGIVNFYKFNKFNRFKETIAEYTEAAVFLGYDIQNQNLLYLTDFMRGIESNPELHGLRIAFNALSITGDVLGVGLAVLSTIPTGGLTIPLIFLELGMLYQDIEGLIKELYPDTQTIDLYEDFYKDRYGISLLALPPVDIKSTSATLKGMLGCSDGKKGETVFEYWEIGKSEDSRSVSAEVMKVVSNQYELRAKPESLEPGKEYICWLKYSCKVHGLTLRFTSEAIDFQTLVPSATTDEAKNITNNSAQIPCEFTNADGLWCGVAYTGESPDGGTEQGIMAASSTEGKQTVTLSGLRANSTYTYYAVVKYNDKEYKGEEKTFTTLGADLSGTWNCKELHYNLAGDPYYTTYSVTLNKDGSVKFSESENIYSSSWSFGTNGDVRISLTDLATTTNASGKEWSGNVDDVDNPTKIIGYTYRWNSNQIGSFNGDSFEFEMTR